MRRVLLLATVLGAMAVAGCSSTSTDARSTVDVPSQWRTAADQDQTLADLPWGDLFRTPELEVLVREALAEQLGPADRGGARGAGARAVRLPALRAVPDRARATRRPRAAGIPSVGARERHRRVELARARRADRGRSTCGGACAAATEAARRQLLASEETRRALYISLIGEVARGYLTLLDLDYQLEVARRTLETRRESLRVVKAQVRGRHHLGERPAAGASRTIAGAEAAIAVLRAAPHTGRERAVDPGRTQPRPGGADARRPTRWRCRRACRPACRPTCCSAGPTCWPPSSSCCRRTPASTRRARPTSRRSR